MVIGGFTQRIATSAIAADQASPPKPDATTLAEVRQLNWASYLLAFSIVGLEVGFLLVYRSGWNLGIAAVLVTTVA